MKPAPNDFDDLLKLLAVKRHEQPPPDYFQDLPDQIMERLHYLEPRPPLPWWQRWWEDFGLKPVLAGAYCVGVCGLLLTGLSVSQIVREDGSGAGLMKISEFPARIPVDQWGTLSQAAFSSEPAARVEPVLAIEPVNFRFNNELRLKKWDGLFSEGR
jgi:hypothetical protein